ncbi:hypothetical protein [Acidovorax sp. LjRoot117]|uniref:hypothetical protein n=1 Tax=Acidovorax sp. LjRoot117 TaxID=3342255 RepID=UPI003ED0EE01
MKFMRWPFFFGRRGAAQPAATAPATPRRRAAPFWLGDALQAVLAWLLPSSAVVVAALGQFVLAAVLCVVACGIWLRLWRGRVRGRGAGRPKG